MKNTIKKLAVMASIALLSIPAYAEVVVVPRIINSSTTWTSDNTYLLESYSFVVTPNGASSPTVLTIEPGTVIMGAESTGANATALVITRGAQIMAEGTPDSPIIFTSELDDLNGNLGSEDVGLWGGLIVLGNASINSRANGQSAGSPAQDQVEGLEVSGEEVDFASFGGTNDADNSGVIRYVSIRHGGARIGGDNEINGLTLGGVGSATTVEYIEVFGNKDDSIEFFGGTVNVKYVVSAFGNDDGIDFDQGYRGKIQFAFVIGKDIASDRADKGGEWDGSTSPLDATPNGNVALANLTMIGIGNSLQPDGVTPAGSNTALNVRDAVKVSLYNSVFVDFAKMVDLEDDLIGPNGAPVFAFPGDYDWRGNVWWSHVSANNTPAGLNARLAGINNPEAFFSAPNGEIADPRLLAISRDADGLLDPRPAADSPAASGAVTISDDWFTPTSYKGAFDPNSDANWMAGWTKLSRDGYLKPSGIYYPDSEWLGEVYSFGGPLTPNNFIYLFGLDGFGYIGTADSMGGWVYIFR